MSKVVGTENVSKIDKKKVKILKSEIKIKRKIKTGPEVGRKAKRMEERKKDVKFGLCEVRRFSNAMTKSEFSLSRTPCLNGWQ